MVKTLIVSPETEPAKLLRLARRYAMTGGVELSLRENLSKEELRQMFNIYKPLIEKMPKSPPSHFKNSIPFKILKLIVENPNSEDSLKAQIANLLNQE
ncbi:MAG: hypothetical protein D6780_06840 [Candidatus Dadabacteria bacterium]|nr:MAG: hypothetical protein D6780_06840 [Candidatus Dadabacteria bacterium]